MIAAKHNPTLRSFTTIVALIVMTLQAMLVKYRLDVTREIYVE